MATGNAKQLPENVAKYDLGTEVDNLIARYTVAASLLLEILETAQPVEGEDRVTVSGGTVRRIEAFLRGSKTKGKMKKKSNYKRKTETRFFIGHQVGFNGKKEVMRWRFETEEDCDKKLSELNAMVEQSRKNPVLNPLGMFDRWWKIQKRVRVDL